MNNKKDAPDIFGKAIRAFFESGDQTDILVHSPDFDDDIIPVPYLFRNYEEMPELEQKALDLATGHVLDVGCGAGSHSLYLQEEKGLQVTGIEISEGAVDICRKRGLPHVYQEDFRYFEKGRFDTILVLMNGIGIVGRMNNLEAFFQKLSSLLNKGGQVLLDSSDLIYLFERDEDGGVWLDAENGYYGELTYSLSYKGETSSSFDWLYLDPESLTLASGENGFSCEIIAKGDHFDYLARLTRK